MAIGTWDPAVLAQPYSVDPALLQRFTALARAGQWDAIGESLSTEECSQHSPIMQLPAPAWSAMIEPLDNDTLWLLMQFFTVAEMQLPGWEAGQHSPVIHLGKLLRSRGQTLSREQLQWIRSHSTNRYLPYGPLEV